MNHDTIVDLAIEQLNSIVLHPSPSRDDVQNSSKDMSQFLNSAESPTIYRSKSDRPFSAVSAKVRNVERGRSLKQNTGIYVTSAVVPLSAQTGEEDKGGSRFYTPTLLHPSSTLQITRPRSAVLSRTKHSAFEYGLDPLALSSTSRLETGNASSRLSRISHSSLRLSIRRKARSCSAHARIPGQKTDESIEAEGMKVTKRRRLSKPRTRSAITKETPAGFDRTVPIIRSCSPPLLGAALSSNPTFPSPSLFTDVNQILLPPGKSELSRTQSSRSAATRRILEPVIVECDPTPPDINNRSCRAKLNESIRPWTSDARLSGNINRTSVQTSVSRLEDLGHSFIISSVPDLDHLSIEEFSHLYPGRKIRTHSETSSVISLNTALYSEPLCCEPESTSLPVIETKKQSVLGRIFCRLSRFMKKPRNKSLDHVRLSNKTAKNCKSMPNVQETDCCEDDISEKLSMPIVLPARSSVRLVAPSIRSQVEPEIPRDLSYALDNQDGDAGTIIAHRRNTSSVQIPTDRCLSSRSVRAPTLASSIYSVDHRDSTVRPSCSAPDISRSSSMLESCPCCGNRRISCVGNSPIAGSIRLISRAQDSAATDLMLPDHGRSKTHTQKFLTPTKTDRERSITSTRRKAYYGEIGQYDPLESFEQDQHSCPGPVVPRTSRKYRANEAQSLNCQESPARSYRRAIAVDEESFLQHDSNDTHMRTGNQKSTPKRNLTSSTTTSTDWSISTPNQMDVIYPQHSPPVNANISKPLRPRQSNECFLHPDDLFQIRDVLKPSVLGLQKTKEPGSTILHHTSKLLHDKPEPRISDHLDEERDSSSGEDTSFEPALSLSDMDVYLDLGRRPSIPELVYSRLRHGSMDSTNTELYIGTRPIVDVSRSARNGVKNVVPGIPTRQHRELNIRDPNRSTIKV